MVKVYKLHPAAFYFLIIVILILVIGTFIFNERDKFQYYLGLFLLFFTTVLFILCLLYKVRIDDNEIWVHFKYLPLKGQRIYWDKVKYVDDDNFLFAHSFHIFPHINADSNIIKKIKDYGDSISIVNFIKNCDDLLREILVRCEPGTKVQEIVLRKADMTWEQVEIERRKRWLKKEE